MFLVANLRAHRRHARPRSTVEAQRDEAAGRTGHLFKLRTTKLTIRPLDAERSPSGGCPTMRVHRHAAAHWERVREVLQDDDRSAPENPWMVLELAAVCRAD